MSETFPAPSGRELREIQSRVLSYYLAVVIISFLGIAVLLAYSISLGPIVGPGVEQSFGFAVALLFLLGALLVHVLDRAYREWPLGRRLAPPPGPVVTDTTIAHALRVLVFVGAAAAIAYIVYGVIAS